MGRMAGSCGNMTQLSTGLNVEAELGNICEQTLTSLSTNLFLALIKYFCGLFQQTVALMPRLVFHRYQKKKSISGIGETSGISGKWLISVSV